MIAFLVVDILIFVFQFTTTTLGGYLLYLFLRNIYLRNSGSLRLVLYMTVCDVICAVCTIPYIVYLVVGWNAVEVLYDNMTVIYISVNLIIQEKIHLTFTLSIALDRALAVFAPVYYRRKNQKLYALLTLFVGICLAVLDLFLEFHLTTNVSPKKNCAAIGCFLDKKFLAYWGNSNMAMGCTKIVITIFVMIKLHQMSKAQEKHVWSAQSADRRFQQANRLSFLVMATSAAFITFPSIIVGVSEFFGFSLFAQIGPFYLLFLLMAATTNQIIYLRLHKDLRRCSNAIWDKASPSVNVTSTT